MDKCLADGKAALKQVDEERARAKADPMSADFSTNPHVYGDYQYGFLLDDEWQTIEITKIYCEPVPNKRHKGYWFNTGYLEYIKHPTAKAFKVKTEVDRVIVSYGYSWKED